MNSKAIQDKERKEKRVINQSPQKSSFISIGNKIEASTLPSPKGPSPHQSSQFYNENNNRMYSVNIAEDSAFNNLFADDIQSPKHFSRRQNQLGNENLISNFKGILNQGKNVRESENIYKVDNSKTPPNSISDKKIMSSKSATHLIKGGNQFLLHIRTDAKGNLQEQNTQQIHLLQEKIKEASSVNDKIEQQLIQLRLKKLQLNSESREVVKLKSQIQELKRKIQQLKNQTRKRQQPYSQYYGDKKAFNNINAVKDAPIINFNHNIYSQRLKGSQHQEARFPVMSRTTSNVGYQSQNPYNLPVSSSFMGPSNPTQGFSGLTTSAIGGQKNFPSYSSRAKIQLQTKMKKSSPLGQQRNGQNEQYHMQEPQHHYQYGSNYGQQVNRYYNRK